MTDQSNPPFYYEVREDHYISIEQILKITDVYITDKYDTTLERSVYSVLCLTPTQTGNEAETSYVIAKKLPDLGAAKLVMITFLEKLNSIRREHLAYANSNANRI